jgi:broad specificity phosphatase PhoE
MSNRTARIIAGSEASSGANPRTPRAIRETKRRAMRLSPTIRERRVAGRWPERLWLVRHGESAGNVARDRAHAQGLERIALDMRDVDVPLSPRGEQQARALGQWFARARAADRPDALLASPYARAQATARLFRDAGGCDADEPICVDERLREKEFGILDGLTTSGVAALEPQQAEFRRLLGKFYHRPPGGESWCDVIFRLRAVMDTIALHYAGARVMIVAHQVVVLCLRYVIERLGEEEILAIDRAGDVANCSVTEYRFDPALGRGGGLALVRYNAVEPIVADAAAPVTVEPAHGPGVRG